MPKEKWEQVLQYDIARDNINELTGILLRYTYWLKKMNKWNKAYEKKIADRLKILHTEKMKLVHTDLENEKIFTRAIKTYSPLINVYYKTFRSAEEVTVIGLDELYFTTKINFDLCQNVKYIDANILYSRMQKKLKYYLSKRKTMILIYETDKKITINSNTLIGVDLSNQSLCELEIVDKEVCNSRFEYSNLNRALFYHSDFSYSNFSNADLSNIIGIRSIFKNSNFSNIVMKNASLEYADFKKANFYGAKLIDSDFSNTYLWGVNFENADLRRVDFSGADLSFCNFTGANLNGANFTNVKKLHTANFTDAILENISLKNIDYIKDIDFKKSKKYSPIVENNITLNLLVLRCKDIERSKKFYEKLKLKFKKEQHGKGPIHYSTRVGTLVLELYPLKDQSIDNTRLGFSLDIQNLKEYLGQEGVSVISEYFFDNTKTYVVQDPDGRKIELT